MVRSAKEKKPILSKKWFFSYFLIFKFILLAYIQTSINLAFFSNSLDSPFAERFWKNILAYIFLKLPRERITS